MDWQDRGIVLASRKHGESSAIVELFTPEHGRHAGVVRGATSRKTAPMLQPGAEVAATWRARLSEHLGTFMLEPRRSRASLMGDRLTLAGLNAVAALIVFVLPEREAHPKLFRQTEALLDMMEDNEAWPVAYLHWELALLDETGFGLDLSRCAATGVTEGLVYVSPKTGCAVSADAAGQWADRLLPLPPSLLRPVESGPAELQEALRTTGHFLHHHLAPSLGDRPIPAARQRLLDRLARQS